MFPSSRLTRDRRSTLLLVTYFALYVVITGTIDVGLFWGEDKFGWTSDITTLYLIVLAVTPPVGAVFATRVLFPTKLGFSKSIALVFSCSAVSVVLGGIAQETTLVIVFISIGSLAWGLYPSITALLTPDESHDQQGHLQGALFALTTLGSVLALGLYLLVYRLTQTDEAPDSSAAKRDYNFSAIWFLSAAWLALGALTAALAGDQPPSSRTSARPRDTLEAASLPWHSSSSFCRHSKSSSLFLFRVERSPHARALFSRALSSFSVSSFSFFLSLSLSSPRRAPFSALKRARSLSRAQADPEALEFKPPMPVATDRQALV